MDALILSFAQDVIGGADGSTSVVVSSGIRLAFLASIAALFFLAGRIFLALAAYNDARSKSNRDALMWALLIGLIGLIPGIVYLCIRNSVHNYAVCRNCGCSHLAAEPNCPQCGAPNPYAPQYVNPMAEQQARQARIYLAVGLVLLALGLILVVAAVVRFLIFIMPMF
jgi:hypothetical protein